MISEIFSSFQCKSLMMDDMAYTMSREYDIWVFLRVFDG